jgi:hypothetical protein
MQAGYLPISIAPLFCISLIEICIICCQVHHDLELVMNKHVSKKYIDSATLFLYKFDRNLHRVAKYIMIWS